MPLQQGHRPINTHFLQTWSIQNAQKVCPQGRRTSDGGRSIQIVQFGYSDLHAEVDDMESTFVDVETEGDDVEEVDAVGLAFEVDGTSPYANS